MQVVQTPSPWAMVASRCTWRSRTRLIASVSASHSCGNSWATWETGQCCWHSCSPALARDRAGSSRTEAAYPSSVKSWASTSAGLRSGWAAAVVSKRSSMNATRRSAKSRTALVATGLGQEAQRLHGEVVVLLVEAVAPALGEREHLGRATSTTAPAGARVARPRRRPPRPAGRGGGARRPGSGRGARPGPRRSRVRRPGSSARRAGASARRSSRLNSTTPVCRYWSGRSSKVPLTPAASGDVRLNQARPRKGRTSGRKP